MGDSIWSQTTEIPSRKVLEGEVETEVAVIGAGMAGILTAYFLERARRQVIVLEADRIAGGQTKNTTAKITSQHGRIYSKLIKDFGRQKAALYAGANEDAVAEYEKIVKENNISCHFERLPAYLYSTTDKKALKEEAEAAALAGIHAHFTGETALPFKTQGAVCFEQQAQFHPLEFMQAIAGDLTIYEHTRVLRVKGHTIVTDRGRVRAGQIIFAAHYPFADIPGFYFFRQHQVRSYVLALRKVQPIQGMYYSMDQTGLSLRMEGDILLLGGGSHRTGKTEPDTGYIFLRKMAQKYFPGHQEIACWSAQDCMPHDGLPFIGKYSVLRPYWYIETGFHKWGMTTSMVAARLVTDLICGVKNPYEKLFSPQRLHIKAGFPALIEDVGISISGLLKGLFNRFFAENGSVLPGRCSHMGCKLEWNGQEQSWDCPCHGSRFDARGKLIDDPAVQAVRCRIKAHEKDI